MDFSNQDELERKPDNVNKDLQGKDQSDSSSTASIPHEENRFILEHGFDLVYDEDGVYIKSCPGAKRPNIDESLYYLKRKGFTGVQETQLQTLFYSGTEDILKIADARPENILNEDITAKIIDRNMQAYIEMLPPDPQGELLTEDKIIEILHDRYNIQFGIDREAIEKLLADRVYFSHVRIAQGREAVRGQDGKLQYHFTLEQDNKVFEVAEDGRINFRDRNKIESVKTGQVLVSRTPAEEGTDGMDVLGKTIAAARGKDVSLPFGKNVLISEDKLQLLAKVGGYVEIINDKIVISPTYFIRGDVDMKVGNVEYEGDVMIAGNVNSGFTIKASGNITINGVVEGAFLESGGDIILKKGIQGADMGKLHAGGNLYAQFIHRANVEVEGKICADIVLHSKIKCESEVELTAKNGLLVGGIIDVGNCLTARTIGMESGVQTKIKLGISPKKRERYLEISDMLGEIRSNIERMDRALKSSTSNITGTEIRMEITKKMLSLDKELVALEKEHEDLAKLIESAKEGSVNVLNKIYPGTRINIGTAVYNVNSEETYVTYRNIGGYIETETCRYRVK